MNSYKPLIILIVLTLLFSGCYSTPKPRHSTDIPLTINLKKGFQRSVGEISCPTKGLYLEGQGEDGVYESLEEAFVAISFNVVMDTIQLAQGTDIYVQPENYPHYTQMLKWGKNTIFIPAELRNTTWVLKLLTKGWYVGAKTIYVEPGTNKIKLGKGGMIKTFSMLSQSAPTGEIRETKPTGFTLTLKKESKLETDTEKNSEVSVRLPAELQYLHDGGLLVMRAGKLDNITIKSNKECKYSYKKKIIYEKESKEVSSLEDIYPEIIFTEDLFKAINPKPGFTVRVILSVVEIHKSSPPELGKTVIQREFEYTIK